MAIKVCKKGHRFEKTSDCPVCPICSSEEMKNKFGENFPKIGAPAMRALDSIGINRLSQISEYTDEQLLKLHGFGPRALKILREKLVEKDPSLLK